MEISSTEKWVPHELQRKMLIHGGIGAVLSILTLSCPVTGGLYCAGVAGIQEKIEPHVREFLQEAEKTNAYFISYGMSMVLSIITLACVGLRVGIVKPLLLTALSFPLYYAADAALKIFLVNP